MLEELEASDGGLESFFARRRGSTCVDKGQNKVRRAEMTTSRGFNFRFRVAEPALPLPRFDSLKRPVRTKRYLFRRPLRLLLQSFADLLRQLLRRCYTAGSS